MKRWIIVSGLVIAWSMTAALGAPAPPAPPTPRAQTTRWAAAHVVDFLDEGEVGVDRCEFLVRVDTFGQAMIHTQYDASGRLIKTLVQTPQGRVTYTNMKTGKSVWSPTTGVFFSRTNPDGSLSWGWNGVTARFVVPGHGLVLTNVGRVVQTIKFDASGTVSSLQASVSGKWQGVVPAICEVLD